jgi:hypothetical protein
MTGEASRLKDRDGAVIGATGAYRREQKAAGKQDTESHWFDIYVTSFGATTKSDILWE